MKVRNLLLIASLLAVSCASAIDLTVFPSSMSWTNQGWVTLSATNLTSGADVGFLLYLDIDANGSIDGDDYPVAVFGAEDGSENPVGAESFVDDNDGTTNGAVESAISCHGVSFSTLHTIGSYIWQAVELDGSGVPVAFNTASFSVTPPASSSWISGTVQNYVTHAPVPGAYIEIGYFSETTGLAPSVWADENGQFTVYIPDGISPAAVMGIRASAKGMMTSDINPNDDSEVSTHFFTNALSSGANELTAPLYTVPAIAEYELYDVSGTAYVIDGDETNLLRGAMIDVETEDSNNETISWGISDINGQFHLVVPSSGDGGHKVWCEGALLNLQGVVGSVTELTVTGAVSGVEIFCRYANAFASARVTDKDTGEPLTGVEVYFESGDGQTSTGHTLTNGFYEIGLTEGTWYAGCDEDSLTYRHYIRPQDSNNISVAYSTVTNVPFQPERGYLISGHVYDTNGTALSGGYVSVLRDNGNWEEWLSDSGAAPDGSYTLLSPTGTVYVRTEEFGAYAVDLFYPDTLAGPLADMPSLNVTTAGLSGIDFNLPYGGRIEGMITDENMNSVSWINVQALIEDGEGNLTSLGSVYADDFGNYGFAVPAGSNILVRTDIEYSRWAPRAWYGGTFSQDQATPVAVSNFETETNINIRIFPGAQVFGGVRDQNGLTGISGAQITAFDAASNRYDTVTANETGDFWNLYVPTNIALVFAAGAGGYQPEFFSDAYQPSDATGIQMASAYAQTNLTFTLYATAVDSDADGLADYQEDSRPDGTFNSGADYSDYSNPDTDSDGSGDGDEYLAGTGPQDAESLFEINGGGVLPSGSFLQWASVSGRYYRVQGCTNLVSGTWSNLYTVTAAGETTVYTNANPQSRAYFRIQTYTP